MCILCFIAHCTLGEPLSSGGTQLYYGNYRYHFRNQWPQRTLSSSLDDMENAEEEERVSVRRQLASDAGFTGKSILHRLHVLYKFDIINDMVFDVMHTILLGNVKRHLDFYKDRGYLQAADIEKRLNKMPWTAGMRFYILTTYILCSVNIAYIMHTHMYNCKKHLILHDFKLFRAEGWPNT